MAAKMISCKSCGTEIAASAKTCPSCGAKNKKPVFKRFWFWALIVILAICIVGSIGGDDTDTNEPSPVNTDSADVSNSEDPKKTEEPVKYASYNVTELFDALDSNALKAEKEFNGKYVEIEGYLGTIDSSGSYIDVEANPKDYDYLFKSVQCFIKDDSQLDVIMEMNSGDPITVRGKITSVGEVLGYSLNIDSIG